MLEEACFRQKQATGRAQAAGGCSPLLPRAGFFEMLIDMTCKPGSHDDDIVPISYDGQPETRAFWSGDLPHWDVLGRPIFLTLHVRGAIPPAARERIRTRAAALRDKPDNDYTHRLKMIFQEMETWLDRPDQRKLLTAPETADIIGEAIRTRAARGWWNVLHWVLMPSHLHILYVGGTMGMKSLMADFKRWTGHKCAEVLGRAGTRFWQDEWFDHWSRSAEETDRIASYVHLNPERAGLVRQADDWPYRS